MSLWSREPDSGTHPCRDALAAACWGRLICQWRQPLQTCPSYSMLMTTHWPVETPLQICPSYNTLRMTHWSVVTSCRCVPATLCWGRLICQWRQSCPSYNMLRTTHWPVETPLQTCSSYNILRMTHWPVHPVDVFQLQHAEDNSLASGDHLQTKLYNPQRKLNRIAWFAKRTRLSLWPANDNNKSLKRLLKCVILAVTQPDVFNEMLLKSYSTQSL